MNEILLGTTISPVYKGESEETFCEFSVTSTLKVERRESSFMLKMTYWMSEYICVFIIVVVT